MAVVDTQPIPRDARVYVAGHKGLAGSAIWRAMRDAGFRNMFGVSSREVDLRERDAAFSYVRSVRPDVVVVAAARVGGIVANSARPVDFLSDNLRIQVNVLDAALAAGVGRLLFLGSSCIYPKHAEQPIKESSLMTGDLEPTNDAYAVAKIAGLTQVAAVRRQYGMAWISAMPTNLYGPGDNFDREGSHVLPGLIRRFHEAAQEGRDEVELWGSGTPRREFLHSDDLGRAVVCLLDSYDAPEIINVGSGQDISIRELAELVAEVVGFGGRIVQDRTRPDGTPRKLLDVSRISDLGWRPTIGLRSGLESTYRWFLEHHEGARLEAVRR
ncbi:GDP-L-fucose synthase family protein [Mycobacterium sp. Marseille-P9652]|uniref:GDP-L-fucose synthase family protein n=1 Tax=Mycobacterium sp. Marseille-P9652 TaxID=2654950 RepID=UPI0012E791A3|nr:GDP-L-fucose synthase [Mycobacterium sp. Marseille-P9652]